MARKVVMAKEDAAIRIVEIQGVLADSFLGTAKRAELMSEQSNLWDSHFEGRPYEAIARDAWLHRKP